MGLSESFGRFQPEAVATLASRLPASVDRARWSPRTTTRRDLWSQLMTPGSNATTSADPRHQMPSLSARFDADRDRKLTRSRS